MTTPVLRHAITRLWDEPHGFLLFAEDRKYAGIQPIDEVRDQIERILVTQMTRSGQERWLERLRRNGYVKHY